MPKAHTQTAQGAAATGRRQLPSSLLTNKNKDKDKDKDKDRDRWREAGGGERRGCSKRASATAGQLLSAPAQNARRVRCQDADSVVTHAQSSDTQKKTKRAVCMQ